MSKDRRHPVKREETYVSVDVETAGPNPSTFSMLSIGACLVEDPTYTFYVELQPVNGNCIPAALAISDLSMETLAKEGTPPGEAMERFERWVRVHVPATHRPIFVAFNAPFDWMFVNDYFHRYLERNPFGYSALDIKAFYMGLTGVPWARTSMKYLQRRYLDGRKLRHHALRDAQDQAELFAQLLAQAQEHH
ncbi:MAG: exonuclease domain-containing protein [Anaerolineae bacterium]